MYDFYFGSKEDIEKDPQKWLLTIKRMLPRWPNGIPDSEYLALYDLLCDWEKENASTIGRGNVLLETGSGASTIVLLYFALKWDVELYTWDISSNKLAYLRGLLTDTLMRHFSEKNIFNHWKYIPYSSNSPHVGIPVLSELGKKVVAGFFDSDHTWNNLKAEISAVCPLMASGGIVAIDDGNYQYKNYNTAYINMIRTKLGVAALDIEDNECQPFWEEVEKVLNGHFKRTQNLNGGSYRETYEKDLFWSYYRSDRDNMGKLGMEKLGDLAHRFDAWKVYP